LLVVFVVRLLGMWALRTVGWKVYQDLRAGNRVAAGRRVRKAAKVAGIAVIGALLAVVALVVILLILLIRLLG
jgi:hypothetical protein